jgi:hypothetical protein
MHPGFDDFFASLVPTFKLTAACRRMPFRDFGKRTASESVFAR